MLPSEVGTHTIQISSYYVNYDPHNAGDPNAGSEGLRDVVVTIEPKCEDTTFFGITSNNIPSLINQIALDPTHPNYSFSFDFAPACNLKVRFALLRDNLPS